jgi:hypothetical protein
MPEALANLATLIAQKKTFENEKWKQVGYQRFQEAARLYRTAGTPSAFRNREALSKAGKIKGDE